MYGTSYINVTFSYEANLALYIDLNSSWTMDIWTKDSFNVFLYQFIEQIDGIL